LWSNGPYAITHISRTEHTLDFVKHFFNIFFESSIIDYFGTSNLFGIEEPDSYFCITKLAVFVTRPRNRKIA